MRFIGWFFGFSKRAKSKKGDPEGPPFQVASDSFRDRLGGEGVNGVAEVGASGVLLVRATVNVE
ncbi:MAG: hypothetical protein KC940_19990, partial [Candidatus Omnitrophica bacterium]|nr:hypothetical protein [Candidatus Omnitrophota bacterium]